MVQFFKNQRNIPIAWRLAVGIFFASILITVLSTGLQVYLNYKAEERQFQLRVE